MSLDHAVAELASVVYAARLPAILSAMIGIKDVGFI